VISKTCTIKCVIICLYYQQCSLYIYCLSDTVWGLKDSVVKKIPIKISDFIKFILQDHWLRVEFIIFFLALRFWMLLKGPWMAQLEGGRTFQRCHLVGGPMVT
jgi:hypothetical protein